MEIVVLIPTKTVNNRARLFCQVKNRTNMALLKIGRSIWRSEPDIVPNSQIQSKSCSATLEIAMTQYRGTRACWSRILTRLRRCRSEWSVLCIMGATNCLTEALQRKPHARFTSPKTLTLMSKSCLVSFAIAKFRSRLVSVSTLCFVLKKIVRSWSVQ